MSDETKPERQWPVVITLKHPVQAGKESIGQLTFREGQLGDLKGVKVDGDGITIDQLVLIAARMCQQPPSVLDKLRGKDAAEALALARDFFTESLTGGDGA